MAGICEGRVVIVTGSGRGLGREHALEFARQGAKVVVNDLGAAVDGAGSSTGPAGEVVDQIRATGGDAVANGSDVADWGQAAALIRQAVDAFGRLDVLVNNAGFLRDRMLANTSEEEWDAVIRVHLKGHFAPARHAMEHWRARSKAGETVDARIINTSSGAGLMGSVGQGNYSAAKAGIAGLTLVEAAELARYGVTANAIAPAARTRMTEEVFAQTMTAPGEGEFDAMAPENVSPLVVWLGSVESRDVTGRVFEVEGGKISVADGWQHGPEVDKAARWNPADVGAAVADLLAKARGHALAAADAHRFEPEGLVGLLKPVDERGHDAGAGHAEGMTQRDRATVHVQLVPRDAELLRRRDDLSGERLVDLDEVDVVDGHPGAGQGLLGRLDRAEPHDLGVERRHTACNNAGQRLETERSSLRVTHHDNRGGAVVQRAGVAGSDRPVGAEHRLQLGQLLDRRPGTDAVVLADRDLVAVGVGRRDRRDLVFPEAVLE
ncbi:MAG: SDR family oxidoreductase [Actinobacteria bacterium]|nr:SDR family oxidoreductase [Actinomycetota bacterium]